MEADGCPLPRTWIPVRGSVVNQVHGFKERKSVRGNLSPRAGSRGEMEFFIEAWYVRPQSVVGGAGTASSPCLIQWAPTGTRPSPPLFN